jgi:hypothetical protein
LVAKKLKEVKFLKSENNTSDITTKNIPSASLREAQIVQHEATIITGKWRDIVQEITTNKTDLGRWSGTKISVIEEQFLHFILAFRVCSQNITKKNSLSTYTQQYFLLKEKAHDNPKLRKKFMNDMKEYIISIKKHDCILLSIDANEPISDPNSEIQMGKDCNLIDLYARIHDDHTKFPTHINGSKHIDFLLCSENLLPYVRRTGITKFHKALDSDHRGMFCDIDGNLFNNNKSRENVKTRQIGTNSTNKEGYRYINYINKQFANHQIREKVRNYTMKS